VTAGPSTKPAADPRMEAFATAVASVRCCGGNQSADNRLGAAMRMGPLMPLRICAACKSRKRAAFRPLSPESSQQGTRRSRVEEKDSIAAKRMARRRPPGKLNIQLAKGATGTNETGPQFSSRSTTPKSMPSQASRPPQ